MSIVHGPSGVCTPVASLCASRWDALAAAVSNPDFELDTETFAAIFEAYSRLKRIGQSFDPMFSALMLCLSRQAYLTDDGIEEGDVTFELDTLVSPSWSAPARAKATFRAAAKGGRDGAR